MNEMISYLTMITAITMKDIVRITSQLLNSEVSQYKKQTILTILTLSLMIINLKQILLIVLVITFITETSISLQIIFAFLFLLRD